MSDGQWWSVEKETEEFYMDIVRSDLGDSNIPCIRSETRPVNEVVGLDAAIPSTIDEEKRENATLYFFSFNDFEYWISDVQVKTDDGNISYANNYQGVEDFDVEEKEMMSGSDFFIALLSLFFMPSVSE